MIGRFSEDIDLSVSPAFIGISEEWVESADSRGKATARMKELEEACIEQVRARFVPELERIAQSSLGERPEGGSWMEFLVDATTHSPVVLFRYHSHEPTGFEYLIRSVKMEFGSLTDQRPVGKHVIRSWTAEEFPNQLADFRCELVALELECSACKMVAFSQNVHHRDGAKPMRDNFSRHYSDVAALAVHAVAEQALAREDLRQRVVDWKSRFFAAS